MRVAVVGTGHLGSIHVKLLKQHSSDFDIVVVEPQESRGRAIAADAGATWFPILQDAERVEAAIIAAPTMFHHELAMYCLRNQIHCFIEKPIAATYEQAREIVALAEAGGCVVQVGHVERFNPAILSIAHIPVEPRFIEVHRLAAFKPRAIDVSVVYDLMIHDIDLLLWLTKSSVTNVHATGVAVLTDTADIANARLEFANGCVANVTASRISARPMRKVRIFQRDAYLSLDLSTGQVETYRLVDGDTEIPELADGSTPSITTNYGARAIVADKPPVRSVNSILEEQSAFFDSIKRRVPTVVSALDGAEAVRIAEIISSQITG